MRAEVCTLWNHVCVLRVVSRRLPSQERSHYTVKRICSIFDSSSVPHHFFSRKVGRCFGGDTDLLGAVEEMAFQLESEYAVEKPDVEHQWIIGGQRRTRTVTEIQRRTCEPNHREPKSTRKDLRCHNASSVRRSAVRTRLSGCPQRQS